MKKIRVIENNKLKEDESLKIIKKVKLDRVIGAKGVDNILIQKQQELDNAKSNSI